MSVSMSERRFKVSQFTREILAIPVEGGLLIFTKLTVRYSSASCMPTEEMYTYS